ncbi:Putative all-trans-retinol 13,14-reductase [Auxenochlorella protothecoides]|uniref:Putative all-trans-retinol 13,14-reductase n=1 Tax=Auxenochlorella protothecoides TaxID=3075 RepID=A0A087SAW9_AUXPR|nr:Putative all-trans-retinol 13,14-reductase [Auxenochlorella protothecoides]KFM22873.1 Putative all-trans-retinol 13,14-reductase [Auxenochlorella protothecoides]
MTHQFRRPGGHWFTCGTHYVGQMGEGDAMREFMDFVTGGVVWDPLPDTFDMFCFKSDGAQFSQPTGAKRWMERLIESFPAEQKARRPAIRRYFRDIKRVYSWYRFYFLSRSMGRPFSSILATCTAPRRRAFAQQTCQQYMDGAFRDRRLIGVLCALWGDYGIRPDLVTFMQHALVAGNNFEGTYYPRLGSRALAKGALALIRAKGGEILLSTRVTQIVLDEAGRAVGVRAVRGGKEGVYRGRHIISDTRLQHAGHAVISIWLGLDASPRELYGMHGENRWISADYRHSQARLYDPKVREVTYAFLSCSALKERYAGHAHSLEVCLFTDPAYFMGWEERNDADGRQDYVQVKKNIVADALDFVDQFVPGLKDHVIFSEVGTPVTWNSFCGWPGGQYITLLMAIDRVEVRRSYSISSLPLALPKLSVTIKRVAGGVASPWLLDTLQPGSTVHGLAPQGDFLLRGAAACKPLGSGLAPLLPMLETALQLGQAVALLGCHRDAEEEVFGCRTAALQAAGGLTGGAFLHEHTHYSATSGRLSPVDVAGFLQRTSGQVGGMKTGQPSTCQAWSYYLCGPTGWLELVERVLLDQGVPATSIAKEAFSSLAEGSGFDFAGRGLQAAARSIRVQRGPGVETALQVAAGQTILGAAEDAALPIPSACRSGNCRRCAVRLQCGAVLDMEDGVVADPGNTILTCRTTPLTDEALIVMEG